MNILIIGASSKNSIGYNVGEELRMDKRHSVTYASRSGMLGIACNITRPHEVRNLLLKTKPDAVILAAGVFTPPQALGSISDWSPIAKHLAAKTLGLLALANAFQSFKTKGPKYLIVLGGRDISIEPGFAVYTVGNGALWSSVQFLNHHTQIKAYYIDLPFVKDSTMEKQYYWVTKSKTKGTPVDINEITGVVRKIVEGKIKTTRILLGKKESA